MALTQEPTRTPTGIGKIRVIITDMDGTLAGKSIDFEAAVQLSDGSGITRHGDLAPHLTPAQKTALISFMDSLRVQAVSQIVQGGV
jgi:hypothetical protein